MGLALLGVVFVCWCDKRTAAPPKPLPAEQQPSNDIAGLGNFARVSEDLYRGAQPTAEGFKRLKEMGVKTIINLRGSNSEKDKIKGLGFYYLSIPSQAWDPKDEDMVKFLRLLREPKYLPAFVHCQYGSDRTGTAVAVYRLVEQGWSRDDAVAEMKTFGLHRVWSGLEEYVRQLDLRALKARLDAAPAPQPELVE
jgi:protein tyrosine/serine phosphatase